MTPEQAMANAARYEADGVLSEAGMTARVLAKMVPRWLPVTKTSPPDGWEGKLCIEGRAGDFCAERCGDKFFDHGMETVSPTHWLEFTLPELP